MSSRPMPDPGKGGSHPGDKDGVEELRGAVAGNLNTPMAHTEPKTPGASTAGGPVGMQVTESLQGIDGKRGGFPGGTGSYQP